MREKWLFSDQNIIDCLNTYYGIKVKTLIFLPCQFAIQEDNQHIKHSKIQH